MCKEAVPCPSAVGRKARHNQWARAPGVPGFRFYGGLLRQGWRTPFGRWVRGYGAARLARDLGLSPYGKPIAVYQWIAGARMPRPMHALRIVALSRGAVRLEHVYGQRAAVRPPPAA